MTGIVEYIATPNNRDGYFAEITRRQRELWEAVNATAERMREMDAGEPGDTVTERMINERRASDRAGTVAAHRRAIDREALMPDVRPGNVEWTTDAPTINVVNPSVVTDGFVQAGRPTFSWGEAGYHSAIRNPVDVYSPDWVSPNAHLNDDHIEETVEEDLSRARVVQGVRTTVLPPEPARENLIRAAHARLGGRDPHMPALPNVDFPNLSAASISPLRSSRTAIHYSFGDTATGAPAQRFVNSLSYSGREYVEEDRATAFDRLLRAQYAMIEESLEHSLPTRGDASSIAGRQFVARLVGIDAEHLRPELVYTNTGMPMLTREDAIDHPGVSYRIESEFAVRWYDRREGEVGDISF